MRGSVLIQGGAACSMNAKHNDAAQALFTRIIDNSGKYRYTFSRNMFERILMNDEESDSTGDHPNRMTGYFLKHIVCLC